MQKKIKNWLIAHPGNNHHPHLLRPHGLGLFVIAFILVQFGFNYAATGQFQVLGYATSINTTELLNLTNKERANHGIAALSNDGQLAQAAYNKAQHMFANNYWAHTAPDGTQPWYFIEQAGYTYTYAAENLAKNFDTSAGVMAGWMNSGSHRQNILSTQYNEVGFAVVNGTLAGEQTTLVVAFYAAPAAPPPAPKVAAAPAAVASTPIPAPAQPVPAPTAKPKATPLKKDAQPVAKAEPALTFNLPEKGKEYRLSAQLPVGQTLSVAKLSSVSMLGSLMLVNVVKHTAIWRPRRYRLKNIWFRSHPLLQASLLGGLIILVLASGLGSVL